MAEKRAYYENNPEEVDKILLEGTKNAQKIARKKLKKIKKSIKIDYYN